MEKHSISHVSIIEDLFQERVEAREPAWGSAAAPLGMLSPVPASLSPRAAPSQGFPPSQGLPTALPCPCLPWFTPAPVSPSSWQRCLPGGAAFPR